MIEPLERTANRLRPVDARLQPVEPESDTRLGLLRLATIVLLIAGVTGVFHVGWNVLFVTAILVMIMLHEFGHFITARWADMKVTDFFVGFGPTLWSLKKGETRYGVKAFPIGGFVRVIGMNNLEEVDPEDEPRTYRAKSYWQRVRFAAAGSFVHFLLAIVLMIVLLAGFGTQKTTTTLESVASGLPAHEAGIRAGDKIVALNGSRIGDWEQVRKIISKSGGDELRITVDHRGAERTYSVTPKLSTTAEERKAGLPKRYMVGIEARDAVVRESIPAAIWQAPFKVKQLTVDSTKALFGLFTPESAKSYGQQLTRTGPADPADSGNRLLSPVGLFRMGGLVANNGVGFFFFMLIAINVFVGIFNLVPLPPFDGGHIAVATYEAIMSRVRGRRYMIDMNKLMPVAVMVIFALLLLGVTAAWLDIRHPLDLG